jgi:hypothetical protein
MGASTERKGSWPLQRVLDQLRAGYIPGMERMGPAVGNRLRIRGNESLEQRVRR